MNMIAVPEWTEYRRKSGLDPLGMQNTSVSLYQTLLPGISNVTLRIRYYGFYAWLFSAYARRVGDTNPKTWQRFLRRAEALYALTAQRRGRETGVAGILWASAKLAASGDEVAFADDAEPGSPTHYLKQPWGAYGAAYGSQLFETGILAQARDHVIPVPSSQLGEALARCFESERGEITERYIAAIERGVVSLDDLDAFSSLSPSEIPPDSKERQLYQELLLGNESEARPADMSRRQSLLLVLILAQQLGRLPEISDVRWALYAGCLPDGTSLELAPDMDAQRRRWWAYQANDLSHICFETLLKFVLDLLAGYPHGLPLGNLIGQAVSKIRDAAEEAYPANWAGLLKQNPPAANASAQDDEDGELKLAITLMKAARQEAACNAECAWAALRLLAVLHNGTRKDEKQIAESFGGYDAAIFRSILTETRFLDEQLTEPFDRTVGRLLEERVIRRHLWIALRKLRYQGDYTFLLEADNGRVRLRDLGGPVFTNPRLGPSITFLRDIGLLDADGITEAGTARIRGAA
ncbi:hypothetical protein [Aureimonas sp. SK2]|uniref:hypothetical protein n=1 Tax=Aureimonas sp. SK2 TaxID=3015992 RepID=UPI002444705D|nr:hypothetical protein [Aureimonas sp. SK2]